MSKTYRVGLVGYGFIGKVHAYGYVNLPFYFDPPPLAAKIVTVVTGRAETAEKARLSLGAERCGTDFRLVTEDPSIDIVHICSPNHLHCEALLSAMAAGKHIYCDKPLVSTAAEADQIEAALAAYRGVGQMTFQNRFFAATMRARQLIDEGCLGRVLQFRAVYLHAGSADPAAPLRWKLSGEAGGGVIADLASHVVDLVEWLLGPIDRVLAETSIAYATRPDMADPSRQRAVDAEDMVSALVRMTSGASGVIEATKVATGAEDEMRFEIHGTHGALRFNLMDAHHLEYFDATAADKPHGGLRGWQHIDCGQRYQSPATNFPTPKAATGWIRSHAVCLGSFLVAIARGEPAEPSLQQGVRVQRLLEALRHSASQRQWVNVPQPR